MSHLVCRTGTGDSWSLRLLVPQRLRRQAHSKKQRSIRAVWEIMPERVWNLGREMLGWALGDSPDLLFDNADRGNDLDSEDE